MWSCFPHDMMIQYIIRNNTTAAFTLFSLSCNSQNEYLLSQYIICQTSLFWYLTSQTIHAFILYELCIFQSFISFRILIVQLFHFFIIETILKSIQILKIHNSYINWIYQNNIKLLKYIIYWIDYKLKFRINRIFNKR